MRKPWLGSLVGLLLGMLVAMRYADLLPGLVPPRSRQVRCCIAAFFIGGMLAAAAALVFNRLGPSGPEVHERYVVEGAARTKGGWDVDIRNGQGRVYTVRFRRRPDPSHPHLELTVRPGALGYPYFTAVRVVAPGD